MAEITLPETKPALEWVNGRALQKVSPPRKHALAQMRFAAALDAWTKVTGAGNAGTEWRFQVEPPGEVRRPLVPDVAFLSYDSLPYETQIKTDVPRIAPNVVVEILSEGDRVRDVEEKIRVYLAAGTEVVFLVDTDRETVEVCEPGRRRRLQRGETLVHHAIAGFTLPVADLFDVPKPR